MIPIAVNVRLESDRAEPHYAAFNKHSETLCFIPLDVMPVSTEAAIAPDLLQDLREALETARHRCQHCGDVVGRQRFESARVRLDAAIAAARAKET